MLGSVLLVTLLILATPAMIDAADTGDAPAEIAPLIQSMDLLLVLFLTLVTLAMVVLVIAPLGAAVRGSP